MSGLPTVRRSLRYLRVVPQAKPRNDPATAFLATAPLSRGIETVTADELKSFGRDVLAWSQS